MNFIAGDLNLYSHGVKSLQYFGICMVDKNGIIKSWSRSAENVFGYSSDRALNKHYTMLHSGRRLPINQELSFARTLGFFQASSKKVHHKGQEFLTKDCFSPIHDDSAELIGYTIMFVKDIVQNTMDLDKSILDLVPISSRSSPLQVCTANLDGEFVTPQRNI
eukprot:TRINITY_DN5274_c0_g1_i1.p1 TRINITY_DN5274_c0_g1~~TRINITY_DN5274_c0_g1_i1.p1  ORF type:complete len:163 (-),score=13.79 TRINITY_DN5274_c0_g1_i1:20-508(-)